MKKTRCLVLFFVLLLCFRGLTACVAGLRGLGTKDTSPQAQTLAPAPTEVIVVTPTPTQPGTVVPPPAVLVTAGPTATPNLTPGQMITVTYIEYASDSLGVVVDENLKVLHIEVDSAAEKAGLQLGDILETIDGISFTKDREKARTRITTPRQDQTQAKILKLTFKRADKAFEVDVNLAPPNPQPVEGTGTPVPTPEDYF